MQLMLTFASCCLVPIIKKFCTHTPKNFCTHNHTNFSWKNLSCPRGERCNPWNQPLRELRALLFTTSELVFQRSLLTMSTLNLIVLIQKDQSNHLQMSFQRQHVILSYLKTLRVDTVWGSNPRLSAHQSGALPTELTGRRSNTSDGTCKYVKWNKILTLD